MKLVVSQAQVIFACAECLVNLFPCLPVLPSFQDGLVLEHWRREADERIPYPYARFNKVMEIPTYTEEEYKVGDTVSPWRYGV